MPPGSAAGCAEALLVCEAGQATARLSLGDVCNRLNAVSMRCCHDDQNA